MPLHSDIPAISTTEISCSKLDLSGGIGSLKNTANRALEVIQNSEWLYVCASFQWLRTVDESVPSFYDLIKELCERQKAGKHKGVRWISTIHKEDIGIINKYSSLGVGIRHIPEIPIHFNVTDKNCSLTLYKIAKEDENKSNASTIDDSTTIIMSGDPIYIQQFSSYFEQLWESGIDARFKIKDLDFGKNLQSKIQVILDPQDGINHAINLIRSAKKEVSIIVSTADAFQRHIQLGVLSLLKQITEECHVKVRVLIPFVNDSVNNNDHNIENVLENMIHRAKTVCPKVEFRTIEYTDNSITIIVVDKNEGIIVESKDNTKDNSLDAAGISIMFSNSNTMASSYTSIFESLWKQVELYEQLKIHDKMQHEFINIAAHELRTPIQPILMSLEIIKNEVKDKNTISIIIRNAHRLQRFANEILDVTRIEGNALNLYKETFDINDKIRDIIKEIKANTLSNINVNYEENNRDNKIKREYSSLEKVNSNVNIKFNSTHDSLFIEADKLRIYEVIYNLLDNAIKFSNPASVDCNNNNNNKDSAENLIKRQKGLVTVTSEIYNDGLKRREVIVRIKDNGLGIRYDIYPNLFNKFVTTSFEGTGLGLFVSKAIIEAHGGEIWAENNKDGEGAVFSFSLPMTD